MGPGALLAKADIKLAYRLVPMHPDDRPLLGVEWKGACYVDAMLPFGLSSAPKVFTAVADALEWCIRRQGVTGIDHYLDDFIIVAPASGQCGLYLAQMQEECDTLGVSLAPEKTEGPATCITFLGIEVDTVAGRLRLPQQKLQRLCQEVTAWKGPRRPHHHVHLNQQVRADLQWWKVFAESWNGIALFPPSFEPEVEFASDASGNWGSGAWCGGTWWQLQWPLGIQWGIAFKELFAVVLSAAVWGREWRGKRVLGHGDNESVTHMLAGRSSRNPELMHLLRCLFFIEAQHGFTLSLVHISGVNNDLADDLSRDRLVSFLSKVPGAQPLPTPLPPPLLELLFDTKGTWTSSDWTQKFRSIVDSG